MWLSDDATADSWTRINVAAAHDRLAADPSWRYEPGFVNDTHVCSATTKSPSGCSCQHPTGPSPTTAYTSLLQVGPRHFLLQYDSLANGWKMPPGPWGKKDHTFSMRFTLKSDDHNAAAAAATAGGTQAAASGAAAVPLPFGNVSCGHVDWVNPPPTAKPARPLDAPLRSVSVASSPHAVALRRAAQWLEAHVVELGAMTARKGDDDVQQPLALVAW